MRKLNFHLALLTNVLSILQNLVLGPVVQPVARLIADPGVMSSISAQSHTFLEIDHEIFSMLILILWLIQEELVSLPSKSMCTKY